MRRIRQALLVSVVLTVVTGCGSLMHPRAGDFLEQAKGKTPLETEINLTKMVESTIQSLHGNPGDQEGLDTLHNQLYALKTSACQVSEAQGNSIPYARAHVLRKEVGMIFHRLWRHRDEPAQREMLLDLLGKRVAELREALQAVPA